MNFRRIFLVKCLLLLFPSVKCSSTRWIYKAVNETALFSITAPGSFHDATWMKGTQRLVEFKDNMSWHFENQAKCRCAMLRNGTLQIQRVVKEDSGNYTVLVHLKSGRLKAEEKIVFIVQEPVPQPILVGECRNKSVSVKCEAKQKPKDEAFTIELTQPNGKKIQKNATTLEWQGRNFGTFRCVVKNQVSEKWAEKAIKCPELESNREQSKFSTTRSSKFLLCTGKMDFYFILSIAGGAVFFVILMICLIYCIRRKKRKRCQVYEEERVLQPLPTERPRGMRELPQAPSKPTPKQLRVQQRPLPQPQELQQPLPPRPRPRTQPRTPNLPRERP